MAYQTNSVNQTTTTQNFERYVRSKDLSKLDFSLLGSDNNTPLFLRKKLYILLQFESLCKCGL